VLAPKLKQTERPGLFLLTPATDNRDIRGDTAAHVRLRLRKWEARRTWAGRILIALTCPLAYLLFMFAGGEAPTVTARVLLCAWVAAMTFGGICADAVWRNRVRLDALAAEHTPHPRAS